MSSSQLRILSPELEFRSSPSPPTIDQRLEDLASLTHSLQARLEKLDVEYAKVKSEYAISKGKAKAEDYARLRAERLEVSEELNGCDKAKEVSEFTC